MCTRSMIYKFYLFEMQVCNHRYTPWYVLWLYQAITKHNKVQTLLVILENYGIVSSRIYVDCPDAAIPSMHQRHVLFPGMTDWMNTAHW